MTDNRGQRYSLRQTMAALGVFFGMMLVFDARGLYGWASKLTVSERSKQLRTLTETWWRETSEYGAEEPKRVLENVFLDFQEAHPLLYPKRYSEFAAKRLEREERARRDTAVHSVENAAKALAAWQRDKVAKARLAARAKAGAVDRGPRVLLAGDSIMAGIGPVLKKAVTVQLSGEADVKARIATGLARPDVFDWRRELESTLNGDAYDFVVMMMGTNDSQDFVENGGILTYGTSEWVKAYTARVDELMTIACRGAARALWVGLPPMRSAAFNRKIMRINTWMQKQASRHTCVEYVPIEHVIGDEQGRFTSYLKLEGGLEKVRMVDGIHVTAHGGEVIAGAVVPLLEAKPAH